MILNIFIRKQLNNIRSQKNKLEERKILCLSNNFKELQSAEDACLFYKKETSTISGWLKSFLPFTRARMIRLEAARRLSVAKKLLNEIEINHSPQNKEPVYLNSSNKIPKKNYSDSDIVIQRGMYGSIFKSIPIEKNNVDASPNSPPKLTP